MPHLEPDYYESLTQTPVGGTIVGSPVFTANTSVRKGMVCQGNGSVTANGTGWIPDWITPGNGSSTDGWTLIFCINFNNTGVNDTNNFSTLISFDTSITT